MGFLDFLKKKADDTANQAAQKINELVSIASGEAARQKRERLLQWQSIVTPDSSDQLVMSEQQLKAISQQQAENDLRIMNDSAKLVESTVNPDVFFSRLQLLWEKAEHLCLLEQYMEFSGASPAAAFLEIRENHQKAIYDFIVRYFSVTFDKAESMKTEKGRIAQYQKFYDTLQNYYHVMNTENINYVEYKYRTSTKR